MAKTQNSLGQSTDLPANPFTTTQSPNDNSTKVATTAYVNAILASKFISSQQTITSGGALTIAHSLFSAPYLVVPWLVCTTANAGYSIGDRVLASFADTGAGVAGPNNQGMSVAVDATNIVIRFGSNAQAFTIQNKGTGGSTAITNADWKILFAAYA